MHSAVFIQDLAIVILVAGLVTLIFRKLKQPVVLGYILAGWIIGPHTPPFSFIQNEEIINTLASLGVIFLMFGLGLHFRLRKLKEVGVTALVAGTLEILLMLLIGYEVGQWFGWGRMDCIFLGGILSISSTTIIVKALEELGLTRESFAELIFGILIIEDILAIAVLALLSGIAQTGSFQMAMVLPTLGRLGIFLTVVLVTGLLAVPVLFRFIGKFASREMLLITTLGLCFGVSLLAILLGYSEALGAFLVGAVIAETREHEEVERLVEPLRDLFGAIFFVSVGLLIDTKLLGEYALPIAVITLVVVMGKVIACSFGTLVSGQDARTSLKVGMGLAQIGEFSFIIAGLGLHLGVTSPFLYPIAVMVSVVTTLLTPYLIKGSDGVAEMIGRVSPRGAKEWVALYSMWMQKIRRPKEQTQLKQTLRKGLLVLILNVLLISAIFIGADYIADHLSSWGFLKSKWLEQPQRFSWFVAMFLSLPFLAASLRNLQSMGREIARAAVDEKNSPAGGRRLAGEIIANTITWSGALGFGLWILYMGSTFFSHRAAMIGMLVILGLFLLLFWGLFIRIYNKFHRALRRSFLEAEK